mmetsp:Transcript_6860/g.20907  ORF Transcript_6860/g.20907 Transcript_6860/m.20907 type:complete len:98 (+) Transcript_6860:187-480(+)
MRLLLLLLLVSDGFVLGPRATPSPLYGKKPKTFDEWSSRRRVSSAARPVRRVENATSEGNATEIADAIARDRLIQFEAVRDGNKLRQHDIFIRHLGM